jgi:predicted dehydrogenase
MKVLIIGTGNIAYKHYKNIKKKFKAEIKFYKRSNKYFNKKIPKKKIIFELSSAKKFDADFLIICSPATKHFSDILNFYNKKIKIFIEKPLFNNTDKLAFFYNYKDYFKCMRVGYQLRYNDILVFLKKILKKKLFGKILSVQIYCGQNLKDWRKNFSYRRSVSSLKKFGGGVVNELSHEIDVALWLFGRPIETFANLSKLSNLNIDVEDYAVINFFYKKKTVNIILDMFNCSKQRFIKIIFEKKTINVDLIKGQITQFSKKNDTKILYKKKIKDPYSQQIISFIKQDKYPFFATILESIDVINVINSIKISSKKKKIIQI